LPDWARRLPPQETRPPRPLAPSSLGEDRVAEPPPGPALRAAAERGRLIHALFERLPALAPVDRSVAAGRWLAHAGITDPAERQAIAGQVMAVLDGPDTAALFAGDALTEAPITATLPDGLVVSGTVDRLLVRPDHVLMVDFKTGRPPQGLADVPPYHLRQMAAYAAALAVIFPGRRVDAALLYTAAPRLIDLPAALLQDNRPHTSGADKRGLAAMEQS
jgi:ATP-dependent helicase/nuclease subunit A